MVCYVRSLTYKMLSNAHAAEAYVTCVSIPSEPKAGDGPWHRSPHLAMEPTRPAPPSQ